MRYPVLLATILIGMSFALTRCASSDTFQVPTSAYTAIQDSTLRRHIQTLASDAFEGRAPSSAGEEKTVTYLKNEFEALGLQPGNGESYFQEVPLTEITAHPNTQLTISGKETSLTLSYGKEAMCWTKRPVEQISLKQSPLVFVGYGIVAPEYGWNDYEGIDVQGKTVLILVNDPGYATGDSTLFNGKRMTYYGRWTYKFEEAARQGAAAALIIHETGPAGYPWEVVQGSWSGEQFTLINDQQNMDRCAIEGWISTEAAQKLLHMASLDLKTLKEEAIRRNFQGRPLDLTLTTQLTNRVRQTVSRNVIARLPGTQWPDEVIIYTAHWDHFGRDPALPGDQIYNGALDNATGTAGLLLLARAFSQLPEKPARSVLFLAVTAEEQGLLGSAYYATHPIYPPEKTVANINMDGLNIWGPTHDITVVGYGMSELDTYAEWAAQRQNRVVRPDPEPEKGYYYRSDHFSFAKAGIPALYADAGIDHVQYGPEWMLEKRKEYVLERYHKPSDEYDPSWDLSGALQDLKFFFDVGYRLSQERSFPNWREGTEFRALRDQQRLPSP